MTHVLKFIAGVVLVLAAWQVYDEQYLIAAADVALALILMAVVRKSR